MTTVDMSTDAVAARVREALLDNDFWTSAWSPDPTDILEDLVGVITEAVTGEQPDQPEGAKVAPQPVLLQTFPVRINSGPRVTEYWARVEVQFQWIEIRATVDTRAAQGKPPRVACYRVGDRLDVRMVAADGTVYAVQSRWLVGGW